MNQNLQNPREIRGIDIAKRYVIKDENGMWFVPSASGKSTRYKVCLKSQKCTCPDYEIRRKKCKHIFAVEYHFEQRFLAELDTLEVAKVAKQRKTYKQNWNAYNTAQTCEKAEFQRLLYELCKGIGKPAQTNGRPRLPLEDMIFACVFKVYSTFSGRRFITDLNEAQKKNYISKVPNYNSIFNYFGMELLTPHLQMLIEESSLPLSALEKTFSIDASGLSTTGFFTWLHAKHTEPRLIEKQDWLKIHCCVGNLTNVVTAVEVTEKHEHDTNQFESLVEQTVTNFEMSEVSADAAYLSKVNLQTALEHGAYPYIAWKSNSRETDKPNNELWNKLYHYYALNKDKFLERYHQRSNSETCFSMVKAKFGGTLRSKTRIAQINEALCKILAHNICCLIQSMFEFGVKPEFWREI
ncbi:MAG: transposase [Acidobacteria bacterium]|jgi:transposase|nr:transposase [Acidobacteriota bacterium]